jgi:hypothetical protein
MPQFYPEHTPRTIDEFTAGYLDAAEWLLDDEVDRDRLRGWTKAAVVRAVRDCGEFQRDNAADLERYSEATGRGLSSAGHDFFLTRNGHGAGYWDRGDDPCLDRLTDAAHACGSASADAYRGWLNWY